MLLLPNELRDELSRYIQTNPSPNVPVGKCMELLARISNLKSFGKRPEVVRPAEKDDGPTQPGGEETPEEEKPEEEKKVSDG